MTEVVAGVARDGDKVLVFQRRGDQKFPYQWEFPGGKVESTDRSYPDALQREWREEMGAEIEVGDIVAHYDYHYPDGQQFRLTFYYVTILTPLSLNQFEDTYWCPIRQLRELNLLDGDIQCVRELEVRHGGVE